MLQSVREVLERVGRYYRVGGGATEELQREEWRFRVCGGGTTGSIQKFLREGKDRD